jgi:hypothetical protein
MTLKGSLMADDVGILLGWHERTKVWILQWLAEAFSYTVYVNILQLRALSRNLPMFYFLH